MASFTMLHPLKYTLAGLTACQSVSTSDGIAKYLHHMFQSIILVKSRTHLQVGRVSGMITAVS